jgi:hypothetical protein
LNKDTRKTEQNNDTRKNEQQKQDTRKTEHQKQDTRKTEQNQDTRKTQQKENYTISQRIFTRKKETNNIMYFSSSSSYSSSDISDKVSAQITPPRRYKPERVKKQSKDCQIFDLLTQEPHQRDPPQLLNKPLPLKGKPTTLSYNNIKSVSPL